MASIGIIGGGVIGLATAEAIKEDFPNIRITIYSDKYSPFTTADVSAGYFFPFLCGQNDMKKIGQWLKATTQYVFELASKHRSIATAVSLLPGYTVWNRRPETKNVSILMENLFGSREVGEEEMKLLTGKKYSYGISYTTASIDCSRYLPVLMQNLEKRGVKFVEKKILSFKEVVDLGHSIIVNTAGIGAKFLTDDPETYPMKGQTLIAHAPWIRHSLIEGDGDSYVIPKGGHLVVGGTHNNDLATEIHPSISKNIWKNACEMIPSLKHGDVIGERVGHRPGRMVVRMEVEHAKTPDGRRYFVLHHYGHGGFGVMTHRGSAKAAAKLLKPFLSNNSKL